MLEPEVGDTHINHVGLEWERMSPKEKLTAVATRRGMDVGQRGNDTQCVLR